MNFVNCSLLCPARLLLMRINLTKNFKNQHLKLLLYSRKIKKKLQFNKIFEVLFQNSCFSKPKLLLMANTGAFMASAGSNKL